MDSEGTADRELLENQLASVIRLDEERWESILDSSAGYGRFSFAVSRDAGRQVKPNSACLIIGSTGSEDALLIGVLASVSRVSTLDTRIVVDGAERLKPDSLETFRNILPPIVATFFESSAKEVDLVTQLPKPLRRSVVDALYRFNGNDLTLKRVASRLTRPTRFVDARALQLDAIDMALEAFGFRSNEQALSLALSDRYTGLASIRVQEDAAISHDARWITGLNLTDSDVTGKAVFERGTERLEIYTANKLPLEEVFGVDLIYFNLRRQALVMVQYKMLERAARRRRDGRHNGSDDEAEGYANSDWVFYPDDQLDVEIERMRRFERPSSPTDAYRLNDKVFFLKFFRRNSLTRSAGVVLALDHFCALRSQGAFAGPRGGVRLSYDDLDGHYLRSDAFVGLIRSGYIGSTGATTEHLATLVNAISSMGRPLVAAIQSPIARNQVEGVEL